MKKFFNWILVLAGCVGAFYGIGLIVPRMQTEGSQADFQTKPADVMAVLADVSSWPQWLPEIATVREHEGKLNDNPAWRVTKNDGASYQLEVSLATDAAWQATYDLAETRHTVRFKLSGLGEGTRVQATRTADTRDPWVRAKTFLLMRGETSGLALLNALAEHLGESANARNH